MSAASSDCLRLYAAWRETTLRPSCDCAGLPCSGSDLAVGLHVCGLTSTAVPPPGGFPGAEAAAAGRSIDVAGVIVATADGLTEPVATLAAAAEDGLNVADVGALVAAAGTTTRSLRFEPLRAAFAGAEALPDAFDLVDLVPLAAIRTPSQAPARSNPPPAAVAPAVQARPHLSHGPSPAVAGVSVKTVPLRGGSRRTLPRTDLRKDPQMTYMRGDAMGGDAESLHEAIRSKRSLHLAG